MFLFSHVILRQVLLVGGTSKIPLVSELLVSELGFTIQKLNRSVAAEEAIALGAAIRGGQISGKVNLLPNHVRSQGVRAKVSRSLLRLRKIKFFLERLNFVVIQIEIQNFYRTAAENYREQLHFSTQISSKTVILLFKLFPPTENA